MRQGEEEKMTLVSGLSASSGAENVLTSPGTPLQLSYWDQLEERNLGE